MSLGIKNLKVFVFDLDDTLYLERDYIVSGLKAVEKHFASDEALKDHDEKTQFRLKDVWSQFTREALLWMESQYPNAITTILKRSPFREFKDKEAEILDIYKNHTPNIRLPEDSLELLRTLKALRRIPDRAAWVYIITDGDKERQKKKLHTLGLLPLINGHIINFVSTFYKPHIESYRTIQQRFSYLEPYEIAYIGDNPSKDFSSPAQLGWYTIRVKRQGGLHYKKSNDKYIARTVSSLKAITEQLPSIPMVIE